ncbi:MAG: hybrid sensor histidine kinase/response regulator [Candidatus Zixiibacteriota bacterium]|nr:MAG: hybrid sensor histidine kinase/response regulator [candidate division Zixibacteria bacterium]
MSSEDVDFEMDEMQEIIDDFLVEADELITSLDNNFVTLETNPNDLDMLNEIFRAAHTIKGTSSFLGLDNVTTVSHKMEDILNKLRKGEMTLNPEIMDVLLEATDVLKVLLDKVRAGEGDKFDTADILKKLVVVNEGSEPKEDNSEQNIEIPTETEKNTEDNLLEQLENVESEKLSGDVTERMTNVSNDKQKDLNVENTTIPEPDKKEAKAQPVNNPAKKPKADQTIRVGVDRLDSLMNMMGELVLGRNSLTQSLNTLNLEHVGDAQLEQLSQSVSSVSFITTELQMAVMKMRMLPIGKVFSRYPRLIRDLSRESKKQIDLQIFGESTELDKSVIEEIGDPLVHIIRNSCDHGIESPEDRVAKGKPAKGTVKLSAAQEGSSIVITVEDDGRGFDLEAIKIKAVERGLTTSSELEKMSNKEIFSFIFEPGFSTAKKITDVSGRGVGMDVVRTNILKLNGLVELNSEVGVGTTITIKLPLTLAIIQGLLVEVDNEVFILPLSSVYETVKMESLQIHYMNQKPVIKLRDDIIPMMNLNQLLDFDSKCYNIDEKPYVIIIGLADKKLGVIVDRFLGQEEVVIKSLGKFLGNTEGIAGATILGDGRIRLIVDMIGLFNVAKKLA